MSVPLWRPFERLSRSLSHAASKPIARLLSNASSLSMGDSSSASSVNAGGTPRLGKSHSRQRSFSVSSEAPVMEELVIPRHEWMSRLMRQHPDVLELRESLRQVLSMPSFSSLPLEASSRTEVAETIAPDLVLRLIDQFLQEFGFLKASETLRKESRAFQETNSSIMLEAFQDGDLQRLTWLGITPHVFDPPGSNDHDPELQAVLEDTQHKSQDINIWNEPSTIASSSSMLQANYLNPTSVSSGSASAGHKNLILEKLPTNHSHHGSVSGSEDESDAGHTHTVKGATFNQLIHWLLSTASDANFRHTFFATLYSFSSAQEFIAKIEQRYTTPKGLPKLDQVELFSISSIMTHWINSHGHEFSDRVYSLLNKFVENTFIREGHHHIAESLQNVIAKQAGVRALRKTSPLVRAQAQIATVDGIATSGQGTTNSSATASGAALSTSAASLGIIASSNSAIPGASSSSSSSSSHATTKSATQPTFPEPKLPKNIFEVGLTLDDIEEEEFARQLTCLDGETFAMMKCRELLKNGWMRNRGKKSKRVVLLLNAANALTRWVLDSVVVAVSAPPTYNMVGFASSTASLFSNGTTGSVFLVAPQHLSSHINATNTKRVTKVITKWLKLCEHLRALNNFHSLLAIWNALRSRHLHLVIEVLRKDLSKSCLDTIGALESLFDHEDSYAAYRSVIADIINHPCIPALPLHLRDLALLEEAHPDTLRSNNSMINFRKRRMLYSAMKEVLRHQQLRHNLLVVYQISDRIQACLITHFEGLQDEKPGGHYDYMSW